MSGTDHTEMHMFGNCVHVLIHIQCIPISYTHIYVYEAHIYIYAYTHTCMNMATIKTKTGHDF